MMFEHILVAIKGAGDLATGVAVRLRHAGFPVVMTELAEPMAIRRTVAFSDAVYSGETKVEDLTARRIDSEADVWPAIHSGVIPILVDPQARRVKALKPAVFIEATLAKRNMGTRIDDAPLVIALGPGFSAGQDAHVVIETNRGHYLGRIIRQGPAQPDTGVPGDIIGVTAERVIFAPAAGVFNHRRQIGEIVEKGDVLGMIGETPVTAPIGGVLRGLLHDNVAVAAKTKIGDVDPRANVDHCWTISEKAFAIGGGVLEAILAWLQTLAD